MEGDNKMPNKAVLTIEKRDEKGSGAASRMRRSGFIPGVVYGKGMDPIEIKVSTKDLREIVAKYGRNTVLDLKLDNQVIPAMIKDIQLDLLGARYEHVDFQRIAMDEVIRTRVPIRLSGEGIIESKGGLVMLQLDELEVECLPKDLPEFIDIDVSKMEIGHSLKVGDIELPEGVQVLSEPGETVLVITETKATEKEESEETAEEEA